MCRWKDNDFAACVQLMHFMGRMCVLAKHFTYCSYHLDKNTLIIIIINHFMNIPALWK